MPLLRRQPFARKKPPADLGPEEEVFFCKLTNEIFRDYEEFFERIILCNSLVWSCAITGRPGLTFQEALESEDKARKHLATFPTYLHRPILFLVKMTHRSRLNEVNDDVFNFTKDRFFKGELVEVMHRNVRKTCRILNVIPPLIPKKIESKTPSEMIDLTHSSDEEAVQPKLSNDEAITILPEKYSYLVQVQSKQESFTAKASQISRKKGLCTRDKCKLFLKQHCDVGEGIWRVKEQYLKQYKLKEMLFDNFFAGPPPQFTIAKARKRKAIPKSESVEHLLKTKKQLKTEKKERKLLEKLEKIERADGKAGGSSMMEMSPAEREAFKERLKEEKKAMKDKYKEELRKKMEEEKLKRKEERDKEREKRKEEDRIRTEYLREWCKPRDDLECDDLKLMPGPKPVRCKFSSAVFGQAVMLLEFISIFEEVLEVKESFSDGLSFDTIEKALVETDPNQSPLADIVIFLLNSIFKLQEEEADEEVALLKDNQIGDLPDTNADMSDVSTTLLVESATRAAQWSVLYHGTPLKKLNLDAFNLTEVLRLHFLSSGAQTNPLDAKFCYQERGGFTSYDDAGLDFRRQEQALMKNLATSNIFDLSAEDKLKILHALMNQLLTYAAVRDVIEDYHEQMKQAVSDLRNLKLNEVRREKEEAAARWRRRAKERAKEREQLEKEKAEKLQEKEDSLKLVEGESTSVKPVEPVAPSELSLSEDARVSGRLKDKKRVQEEACLIEEIEDLDLAELRDYDEDDLSSYQKNILQNKRDELETEHKGEFKQKVKDLNELIYELQFKNALLPVGRDRMFRRFWIFKSMPGLFVEHNENCLPDNYINPVPQVNANPYKRENLFQPAPDTSNSETPNIPKADEKNAGSDKENESIDGVTSSSANNENNIKQEEYGQCVVDQILNKDISVWSYFSTEQTIEKLISSLNCRGFRESFLRQALMEQKDKILQSVTKCPEHLLNTSIGLEEDSKDKSLAKLQSIKSRNRTIQGAVKNDSGEEIMELTLREMILDLEERIYTGSLGWIKVNNRVAWRDAIESGSYDAQTTSINWKSTKDVDSMDTDDSVNGEDTSSSTSEQVSQVVKDLSKAVYQIAQCIEDKYLIPPLGESDQKRPKKTDSKGKGKKEDDPIDEDANDDGKPTKKCRDRWVESLMLSTSLSHIFLHLSTLESSIAWTKSALHARCRICRRKGDAEKMLLCDGCDRGHHMYCLKPAVKHVPTGDWYCPNCRPKDIHRSPRKQRKKLQKQESDNEDNESDDEDDSSSSGSSDSSSSSGSSSSESSADSDEEEAEVEEEEEEKPLKTGIRIKGKSNSRSSTPTGPPGKRRSKGGLITPGSGRSTPTETVSRRRSFPTDGKRKSDTLPPKEARAGKRSKPNTPVEEAKASSYRKSQSFQHMKQLESLVGELVKHESSWPFIRPVSKRDAPDYYQLIEHPMDLSTIRTKLNKCAYTQAVDVIEDARLIFRNCDHYNMPSAEEYKCGHILSKFLEKRLRESKLASLAPAKSKKVDDTTPTGKKTARRT